MHHEPACGGVIRAECQSQKSLLAPCQDLRADVEKRHPQQRAVFHYANRSSLLHDEQPAEVARWRRQVKRRAQAGGDLLQVSSRALDQSGLGPGAAGTGAGSSTERESEAGEQTCPERRVWRGEPHAYPFKQSGAMPMVVWRQVAWSLLLGGCTPLGIWLYEDPVVTVSRITFEMRRSEPSRSPVMVALALHNRN